MIDDLHPAYRAHVEWALFWCGIHQPDVTEGGEITGQLVEDGPKIELLSCPEQLPTLLKALVLADAACGSGLGREIAKGLADEHGVHEVHAGADHLFQTHREFASYLWMSADHVARRLDAQLRGEVFDGWLS